MIVYLKCNLKLFKKLKFSEYLKVDFVFKKFFGLGLNVHGLDCITDVRRIFLLTFA